MAKKVLSVVLALVLTLGVCVIAVSAAAVTTDDVQKALQKLPSEYNAQFYTDSAKETILNARKAAEAAIISGEARELESALQLCKNAFDVAYEGDDEYIEAIEDYVYIYSNRDESKAKAFYKFKTDDTDGYLKKGETVSVTISMKTNFYVRSAYLGFAYDKNIFEFVSESHNSALDSILDYTTAVYPTWGRNKSGAENPGGYPESWSKETKSQYNLMCKVLTPALGATEYLYPTDYVDVLTVTMKVKSDTTDGVEGRIFTNLDLCASRDNFYLGNYEKPLYNFTRGYAADPSEMVADLDGVWKMAKLVSDQNACGCQTIEFENADLTFTVGEKPADLDYTALNAALADAAKLVEENYSPETWSVLSAAVKDANDNAKNAKTQLEVDAFTDAITNAIKGLAPAAQDSEIISVTPVSDVVYGELATVEVLVSSPAQKLQFINSSAGTITFSETYGRIISVVNNPDGTQTWTLQLMVYKLSETYNVKGKFDSKWSEKNFSFVLADTNPFDDTVYSCTVSDEFDGRITKGTHTVTFVTGKDVTKVQFKYDSTSTTFTADNAEIVEKDGKLEWTATMNFSRTGTKTFDVYARTNRTAFTQTDISLDLEILY